MSLVNINSVLKQTLPLLDKSEPFSGVELLSYKRNRHIAIIVREENRFQIREQGYLEQELEIDRGELEKILKIMIKREFPRSRKIRLHKFVHPDELERSRKIL